jgi:hypothetical protein
MAPEHIDTNYWISHSEGFQVREGRKKLGFVQEVIDGGRTLAVRGGLLGRRVVYVPVDQVFAIVPRDLRIWLLASPTARAPRAYTPPVLADALSPSARAAHRHGDRIAA